jgi:hypothetical protein
VCRDDVKAEFGHQPLQARHLAFRDLHHQAGQRGRVDDRVLERTLQAASDEPGVERVVAVLDQHRRLGEAEECPSRVLELGCADEHRAVDVVTLPRVGIDGRAAVDQRVEKRKCAVEGEPLGADLEDEERGVARGLDVERHELRIVELRPMGDRRLVDGDLFPGDRLDRSPRLEEQPARRRAHLASANARRAHAISSPLRARSSRMAAP